MVVHGHLHSAVLMRVYMLILTFCTPQVTTLVYHLRAAGYLSFPLNREGFL